ncbi:ABC transporter permease subunit [Agromyces sp. CFH 90414]|uniref:ABC transporter permease subunit n=1 Tax=Agromyces agglutinans TaxID=2662258 RepID=A0A6I2FB25_9MICO|nr:ABC transporter permease [Agromyces agglutinans]MRG61541.1 ABC transporter permease subunit [Agromyces agglutinans]
MNVFAEAFAWLFDPANWEGPDGIGARLAFHVVFSLAVVAGATIVALPIGVLIGHTGRGREPAVVVSGALRALPTLGLLTILALAMGLSVLAPYLALVVLAIPSVLAGAYAGVGGVSRTTVDAARAMGMTEGQIVLRVEAPLGLPTVIGGIRSAVLQVVATATLAAYIGGGGLGTYLFSGLKTGNYPMVLGVSMLIIALALVLDGAFALTQRLVVPEGVRVRRGTARLRSRPSRPRAAMG